jgi:hypothetical protein
MEMKNMKKIKKIITLFALTGALCAVAAAGAQRQDAATVPPAHPSIADFAFRHSLGALSEGRVYRVHVTNDIFGRLRRSYETDLAVFDSDANPVPFIVRDVKRPYRAQAGLDPDESAPAEPVKMTVPLFPLPATGGREGPSTSMMDVTIRTGDDGQVIEIVGGGSKTQSGGGKTNRFLADLSRAAAPRDGRRIVGYDIEIPAGGEEDTEAYADLYASDSLRDWRRVARREPLIRLRRGDDVVASGVIRLDAPAPIRYLMLEIDGVWEFPDSLAITMRLGEREAEIQRDSASFEGRPDGGESRSVVYDTAGAFPASEVNFILENPGVYMASVSSRGSAQSEWRRLGDIRLSFIKSDAGDSRNAPIQVREFFSNDRFWKLTAQDRLPSPPPAMQISWRPKEIVFVAQGPSPYILAFGCHKNLPGLAKPELMPTVLGGIGERNILEAEIGASITPASFDQPPAFDSGETPDDTQWEKYAKYVVWAVLVGGALLLSWISWSLIQKGKSEE